MKKIWKYTFFVIRKIIKLIFIGITAGIGFFLIIPALVEPTYEVEKSVIIDRSPDIVYRHLLNFDARYAWDPWLAKDPKAQTETSGYGKGSNWLWDGPKIGRGIMTIHDVAPNKLITAKVAFAKRQPVELVMQWQCEAINEGTKTRVTWRSKGTFEEYPKQWFGILAELTFASDFEIGLSKLKAVIEEDY